LQDKDWRMAEAFGPHVGWHWTFGSSEKPTVI